MQRILICGTLAYDLIGTFDSALTPDTRNVKLQTLHQAFGGCAMNIAYNVRRLAQDAIPLAYAGVDYEPEYAAHIRRLGISEAGIIHQPDALCARGIILTASDGAQLTAFYPGPQGIDTLTTVLRRVLDDGRLDAAILAPDQPEKTLACLQQLIDTPLKVWCPGQYAEHVGARQIEQILDRTDMLVVNRQEWLALREQMPAAAILNRTSRVIVTHGAEPVLVLPDRLRVPVPPIPIEELIDPTGCGDAFVAALTVELAAGAKLAQAIAAGVDLAGQCLRRAGAQCH